ncbi:Nucleotide-binding universal stress protein, UspA family [Polaromonas sp. OV174]|uniref:universal stress protein n=1 Tax=Polaromonas sp. OV174 TaxID=1855300 RepID=UPI0008E7FCCA|nr:universal stress protein [Polaromonas sp. OV174]SFC76910.1 Nucleotide-binding universal stress protein, UspA family [Polaromonas sp. OV174]
MYQCILIATDGSELSREAVNSGIELAAVTGAKVIAFKVVPRYPVSYFDGGAAVSANEVAETEKQWAESSLAVVEGIKAQAQAKGVTAEAVTAHSDLVAESIIAAAKKHNCDLIVMASHGRRGLKRLLLGSETTHVLTHSHIPVLVLRPTSL